MQQTQTAQPVFDAASYKQTTLEQWNDAAEAWDRWGILISRWLGPATETMLDMAGVTQGSRVLDVAAGAGEQTIAAARRAGSTGHVLATDLSPTILEYAERTARLAGLDNIGTQAIDGERLDELDAGPFDLHQMLRGLSDAEKDEAWEEIEQALKQFETTRHFEGPCEMLIAVGTR